MTAILTLAIVATLATTALIVVRHGKLVCQGTLAVGVPTFIAILFTTGLDVGLILFPLLDFPVYAEDARYAFANPLAIEFGFWGFLVWGFYFLTTFYFCVVEPQVQLFERPALKLANNAVIIATCAFTVNLFFDFLPQYIAGIGDAARNLLVVAVLALATLSSTRLAYVKLLSVSSYLLFLALILLLALASDSDAAELLLSLSALQDYFANIHRFVYPITDYHAFYLFWWFAWSIMIGQFVSRFVSGLTTWQLLVALLVVPSIPIALWFAVLYGYFESRQPVPSAAHGAMVVVGVVFLINSVDSLIRLYTQNLGLTLERLGFLKYLGMNVGILGGLLLLYQLTPLKIEWIGLAVIGIYFAVAGLLLKHRATLSGRARGLEEPLRKQQRMR
ncbi:MAG: BCCT family transporter [Pseudomonadota bacterium]